MAKEQLSNRDRPAQPAPYSLEDLRQRLDRLPPSHPSSPRYRGGEIKPVRLRDLELPIDGSDADADRPQPAASRAEWQEPLARGEVDQAGLGVIDERQRRFFPPERRIAEYLARTDGVAVVAFPEDHRARDRQRDADVDGKPVEFKNPDPGADHGTVKNTLRKSIGQAPHVVIDGRDTGLTGSDAERGLRRFFGTPWSNKIDSVRIIGDDFDIAWKREESYGADH